MTEKKKADLARQSAEESELRATTERLANENVLRALKAAQAETQEQIEIRNLSERIKSARTQLQTDPEQSMHLAKEAVEGFRTIRATSALPIAEAEDVLRQSLLELNESKVKAVMRGHTDSVQSVAFSPNGEFVVTTSADNTARVWNASTGQHLVKLDVAVGHPLKSAKLNRDGKYALTVSEGQTILVWDTSKPDDPIKELEADDATFSRDGKSVVMVNPVDTASVWTIGTKDPVQLSLDGKVAEGGGQEQRPCEELVQPGRQTHLDNE